jgi:DNA polymerase III delta prime subunit
MIELDWTTNQKYTPKTIGEMALYPELKQELLFYEKNGDFPNLLLMGDTGTGKTTASRILGNLPPDHRFMEIDCGQIKSDGAKGVKTLKEWIVGSQSVSIEMLMDQGANGRGKRVMILDEFHVLSASVQSNLYKPIEMNTANTKWIFCVNSEEAVKKPIKSRCSILYFTTCVLNDKTGKLEFLADTEMDKKSWCAELTRIGKILEKKTGYEIPDRVYERVLSRDGNLIDSRKFIQSLNRTYAMDAIK